MCVNQFIYIFWSSSFDSVRIRTLFRLECLHFIQVYHRRSEGTRLQNTAMESHNLQLNIYNAQLTPQRSPPLARISREQLTICKSGIARIVRRRKCHSLDRLASRRGARSGATAATNNRDYVFPSIEPSQTQQKERNSNQLRKQFPFK